VLVSSREEEEAQNKIRGVYSDSSWGGKYNTLYTVIFKVAFSTFQFKFGATLRRQAERSDSEARHKAPNLT